MASSKSSIAAIDPAAGRRGSLLDVGPGTFRMALALLVFGSHTSRFEIGRPAVILFFVLSGYWVVRLFDHDGRNALRFGINRFLRVWPLLAVTALIVVALTAVFGLPSRGSLLSTLFLLGLATRGGDVIGVSWSLDIELQFYLLVVAIALALRRLTISLSVVGGALAAAVLTSVGIALLSRNIWTVAAFIPAFAAGAGIYLTGWKASRRAAGLSIVAWLAVGLLFALVPMMRTLLLKQDSDWWRDIVHMAWCLMLTPFIAYNVRSKSSRLDRHLGNLSFPFYLIHPVIISVVATQAFGRSLAGHALALALALVASLLLYFGVDRPFERVRHRVSRAAPSRAN